MKKTPWFQWDGADLVLLLHVKPQASREGFSDITERGLGIRLTASPTDGKANAALQSFLAREFDVPKGAVELEHGATGRTKRVRIHAPRRLPPQLHLEKP